MISQVPTMRFTETDAPFMQVSAGGAGWIDSDCSAIVGTDSTKIWVVWCQTGGAHDKGVRRHGSTAAPIQTLDKTTLVQCDSSGHIDLYRNAAADAFYVFMGSISL